MYALISYENYKLELGLSTSSLEDGLERSGLHNVTLDLELTAHEQLLSIGLTVNEVLEVSVSDDEGDVGLGGGLALANLAGLLGLKVPALDLASGVLDVELNNGVGLLEVLLLALLVRGNALVHEVESSGGREFRVLEGHFRVSKPIQLPQLL